MNLQLAMALLTVVILDGFAPCKGIQMTETRKSLLMESGIQLKESGIPLTIVIQNPSSNDKYWNPVPRIRNPQCEIRNPRLSWIPLHEANSFSQSDWIFTITKNYDLYTIIIIIIIVTIHIYFTPLLFSIPFSCH